MKVLYKGKIIKSKSEYNNKRLNNGNNICKESWKIINKTKNNSSSKPSTEFIENERITDKDEIINYQYFFTKVKNIKPDVNYTVLAPFSYFSIFLYATILCEIKDTVDKTTKKSAPGIDEIHGKAVKIVSDIICLPLSHAIDLSFCERKYPED